VPPSDWDEQPFSGFQIHRDWVGEREEREAVIVRVSQVYRTENAFIIIEILQAQRVDENMRFRPII
jgi:hypothetical protein